MIWKKVALLGAGAVGGYFVYGLNGLKDVSFCLVAEGKRAEELKTHGITINERVYYPEIKTPEEAHGVDLLIVCTKYHGLHGALDAIEKVCDDHTTVISLLNGIDSEEIIGSRIGMKHMLYSVMRISSERRDGKIHFIPENVIGVALGEKNSAEVTPRMKAFGELMEAGGLKYSFKKDIILDQWKKYAMNIIYNLPQAVLGVGFGAYYDSSYVAKIRDRMYDEVCAVGQAEGVKLGAQADWSKACLPTARFSTLQDLDAGRHTEIEMFLGVLLRLAENHGLSIPFCEYTYCAIKALEEKGDGKFQY